MQVLNGGSNRYELLAFAPDGARLAACGWNSAVNVWDTATGMNLYTFSNEMNLGALAFHPDGTLLVGGRGVTRYTFTEEPQVCVAASTICPHLALAPDGAFVVVSILTGLQCYEFSDVYGFARAWEATVHPLGAGFGEVIQAPSACVLPDGARCASVEVVHNVPELGARFPGFRLDAGHVSLLVLRATATGKVLSVGAIPVAFAERPRASPDGARIVVIAGRSLYAFDAHDLAKRPTKVMNTASKHFTAVAFDPTGRYLVAASNDATVRVLDAHTFTEVRAFTWKIGRMRSVCFSPDGLRIAAGGERGRVVVWDADL
jgi:WD40 repeat protein